MGTVVSIDLRGDGSHHAAIADVTAWLHEADRRFSPYESMTILADGRIISTDSFPRSVHGVPLVTVAHSADLLGAA